MRTKDPSKERAIRKKAVEMIAKQGLDGLSMQKLAASAHVSPATLYLYFKDRDDLILQVYIGVSKQMTEAALKDFDPSMHFAEGLKRQWINRAAFCMKYPMESAFLEQMRHSLYHSKAIHDASGNFGEVMRKFVQNAIKRKELVPFNSFEVFWSVLYAPLYQLVKFHEQGRSVFNKKFTLKPKNLDQALALVIRAVTP